MKKTWDRVTLRVDAWHGPAAEPGDELRTGTGRRYQILEVKPKALVCLVLPADEPVQGMVFNWIWTTRKKSAPRGQG